MNVSTSKLKSDTVLCSGGKGEVSVDACLACARAMEQTCGYDYALVNILLHDKQRIGIHVTDITGCLRKAWYEKTNPQPEYLHSRAYILIGNAMHEYLENHGAEGDAERTIEACGLVGTMDVYRDRKILDFKCQPAGELVTMADGSERPIEEICIFDEVLTAEHTPARVTAIVDGGIQEVVKIKLASGQVFRASKNHPVMVIEGGNANTSIHRRGDPVWKPAGDLKVGDNATRLKGWTGNGDLSPEDARLIGYLIGDGGVSQRYGVHFTNADKDILSDFGHICRGKGWDFTRVNPGDPSHYSWRITNQGRKLSTTGVSAFLAEHDMRGRNSHTKVVPDAVMKGNSSAIANFLAGYFDTDGSITDPGGKAPARITITSVSGELIRQTCELLRRLDIDCRAYFHPNTEVYHACVWAKEDIMRFTEIIPVHSGMKKGRLETWCNRFVIRSNRGGKRKDRIDTIVELGPMQTIGLEVEGSHTYFTSGVLTHNTTRWLTPSKLPYGSHANQVNIYAEMMRESGFPVDELWLQYIDMSGPTKCKVCKAPFEPEPGTGYLSCPRCGKEYSAAHTGAELVRIDMYPREEVRSYIDERRDTLLNSLETMEAPAQEASFLCSYCSFKQVCNP